MPAIIAEPVAIAEPVINEDASVASVLAEQVTWIQQINKAYGFSTGWALQPGHLLMKEKEQLGHGRWTGNFRRVGIGLVWLPAAGEMGSSSATLRRVSYRKPPVRQDLRLKSSSLQLDAKSLVKTENVDAAKPDGIGPTPLECLSDSISS
jgi:hypothetical protein